MFAVDLLISKKKLQTLKKFNQDGGLTARYFFSLNFFDLIFFKDRSQK